MDDRFEKLQKCFVLIKDSNDLFGDDDEKTIEWAIEEITKLREWYSIFNTIMVNEECNSSNMGWSDLIELHIKMEKELYEFRKVSEDKKEV